MVFRSLLSRDPRWQSQDPAERAAATALFAPDSAELLTLARDDADASVRAAALARTANLDCLRERVAAETDPVARESAIARAAALIGGSAADAPDPAVRHACLAAGWDPAVLERVVVTAADAEAQRLALAATGDAAALARIAGARLRTEVRLAALERIDDPAVLAAIAREQRGHDKSIWRRAQQRLDQQRDGARKAIEAERLVTETDALAAVAMPAASQLAALQRAWDALGYDGALAPAFTDAAARVRAVLDRQAARQQAASSVIAGLNQLREGLPHDGADPAAIETAGAALANFDNAWAGLDLSEVPKVLVHQHAERRAGIEARLETLRKDVEALAGREALLGELEQRLAEGNLAVGHTLLKAWERLPAAKSSAAAARQASRLESLRGRLAAARSAAAAPVAEAPSPLAVAVTELEQAIAEGTLAVARARLEALAEKQADGAPPAGSDLARRIEAARQAVADLADWQRWGNARAHEQLCAEAEALVGRPLPAPEIARSVKQLRDRWRALDHEQGAAPRALWNRFDRACTRAYEPAKRQFEEQARVRAENLALREAFCRDVAEQVQAFVGAERPAKEGQRHVENWQRQWHEMGPTDRTRWKELEGRFGEALAPVRRVIDEAVARSRQKREHLIAEATALAQAPARQAVATVKTLQAAWKQETTDVMLPRRDEQRLWETFRGACNAVFERRDAEAKEAGERQRGVTATKAALLDQIEALLPSAAADRGGQLQQALAALEARWREAGTAGRDAEKSLGERRARIEGAARAQLSTARRSRHLAVFDTLAERAALCSEAERLVELPAAEREAIAAELGTRWKAAARLPAELESAVHARFERALAGRGDDAPAAIPSRRELCLRAEILAGVDSPAEEARERMALRVEDLNRSVSGDVSTPLARMQALAGRWHGVSGPAEPALQQRWERALASFLARAATRAGEAR
jgi:hypothetical protein